MMGDTQSVTFFQKVILRGVVTLAQKATFRYNYHNLD